MKEAFMNNLNDFTDKATPEELDATLDHLSKNIGEAQLISESDANKTLLLGVQLDLTYPQKSRREKERRELKQFYKSSAFKNQFLDLPNDEISRFAIYDFWANCSTIYFCISWLFPVLPKRMILVLCKFFVNNERSITILAHMVLALVCAYIVL